MLTAATMSFNLKIRKMKHRKVKYLAQATPWAGGRVRKRKAISSDFFQRYICQTVLLSKEATLYS